MTDEEKVKQKWPDARCLPWHGKFMIVGNRPIKPRRNHLSELMPTQVEAWQDAAQRIEAQR